MAAGLEMLETNSLHVEQPTRILAVFLECGQGDPIVGQPKAYCETAMRRPSLKTQPWRVITEETFLHDWERLARQSIQQ
jgi:hypothetical protein